MKLKEVKNKYKCAPKIWKKFLDIEKRLWNGFYVTFSAHMKESMKTKAELHVLAHNIACLAVWECQDFNPCPPVTKKMANKK